MPASCSAWWCASETPRRSASIAAICVARHQSLERRRRRRRRTRDRRRRSTGSTELDTSDRWARGGMGARRWARLLGCRGPSRLPRPPTSRSPPTPASSSASAARRTRRSWRTCSSRRRRRRAPGPPAPPPSRPRRGPSDGGVSRHPTDPCGRSSAWPSPTLLGRCASASSSGSILLLSLSLSLSRSLLLVISEIIAGLRCGRQLNIKVQRSRPISTIFANLTLITRLTLNRSSPDWP